jgi:hypothetical protein
VAFLVPNEGEIQLLTDLLAGGTLENWTLKLYKTNVTPAETDTGATYTVADFTSYANKTLTRSVSGSTWQTVAGGSPSGSWSAEAAVAKSSYGSAAQSWTCGASGNTIYGYYIVGATSTKLICAELFASSRTLANGDTLSLTPVFEAA